MTYGAVGSFAPRNDLHSQDLVAQVCLVGPRDTDRPERWRVLVAWLIAPKNG
ncbi:hypothetical protein [Streptomyces tendae]|uniref:hypothetical protein n=1 Tax=Streptomyces tendae TaxID=1932 RepID=UPI00371631C0